jgi:hypothetical protein
MLTSNIFENGTATIAVIIQKKHLRIYQNTATIFGNMDKYCEVTKQILRK